jgi:hypothetical protein
MNPKLVSDRIGHANLGITLTTYAHRSTGQDRTAAEQFARLLFGDPPEPCSDDAPAS